MDFAEGGKEKEKKVNNAHEFMGSLNMIDQLFVFLSGDTLELITRAELELHTFLASVLVLPQQWPVSVLPQQWPVSV